MYNNLCHPIRGQMVSPVKARRARELRKTMTPEERLLWNALREFRARGFPFRRQQPLAGFIADFYCHCSRLVVEVDGDVRAGQPRYDEARTAILEAAGLRVVRFTNQEVHTDLATIVRRIESLCAIEPVTCDGRG